MSKTVALRDETLRAFGGDELRARVFYEKYALHDLDGRPLESTPEQMWARVAREIASVERTPEKRANRERQFQWLLSNFRFLPGGRIMHGAGSPSKVTLLNCYLTAIRDDTLEDIYAAAYRAAKTYSRGGGIGIDVTPLRPRHAPVHNAARTSTGAVSFMELFSLTTGLIGQAGRRGALMLTIADHHPDVLDFCRVKRDLTSVRYANISVRLTDAFMRAVEQDGSWTLWFEGPQTGRIERTIGAKELWWELVEGARDWAEPGCMFWDRVLNWGTSNYAGMTPIGTNPCNEIPLEDGGACNLGSINLARFVLDPFTPAARINYKALRHAVCIGVQFLDNVLIYNEGRHPLPEQEEAAKRRRRIGLGITGLGDMLVMLGLRYGSDESIRIAGELMRFIKETAYRWSTTLACAKDPFPAFDAERHLAQPFFSTFPDKLIERIRRDGLRNVSVLTIPPVGSGSAMAGCTNGLEPIFALSYVRRSESLSQEVYRVLHPLVAVYAQLHQLDLSGLSRTADPTGYLREKLPEQFVTAHEIDPIRRVDMQAALQKHIDQSISSTVNLPEEATAETVERVYSHAWKSGLKGISVYREGSREGVLLTPEQARAQHKMVALADRVKALATAAAPDLPTDGSADPAAEIEQVVAMLAERLKTALVQVEASYEPLMRRPDVLAGLTYRIRTRMGTMFVTINETADEPVEVFCRLGKGGSHAEADSEMAGRLISAALRLRGPVPRLERLEILADQLEGIGGGDPYGFGPSRVKSIADGIAKALRRYIDARRGGVALEVPPDPEPPLPVLDEDGIAAELAPVAGGSNGNLCPRCQQFSLVTHEGCSKCGECGYKEC